MDWQVSDVASPAFHTPGGQFRISHGIILPSKLSVLESVKEVKHYLLRGAGVPNEPNLVFNVEIDWQDVRSGYRGLEKIFLRSAWLTAEEPLWTPDMVTAISPEELQPIAPPSDLEVPQGSGGRMKDFLNRFYRRKIWKNQQMGVYSKAFESKGEFISRCRESLYEPREREMAALRELFLRHLLELENRALLQVENDEMGDALRTTLLSNVRDVFALVREDMSRCFVRDDHRRLRPEELDWSILFVPDLHDRMIDLRNDLVTRFNQISESFERRATAVEEHLISASRSDIQIAETGIVWK